MGWNGCLGWAMGPVLFVVVGRCCWAFGPDWLGVLECCSGWLSWAPYPVGGGLFLVPRALTGVALSGVISGPLLVPVGTVVISGLSRVLL